MINLSGTNLNSFSWPEGCSARIAMHKITQDVREYAAKQGIGVEVAMEVGMKKKAEEFKDKGSEIYLKS